ncbi:MAG: hypothetical protein JOZ69_00525, partial [Myxococcales bacterium]|nr:hypothetical protein [Myxococcales bacterium]
ATAVAGHLHADRKRLHEAALSPEVGVSQMHALARAAMLRHPSEPYLPFATALRAVRARDDNPIPWLGAVLERGKVYGPAHLLLARVLSGRSLSQARLEYRFALQQAPEAASIVAEEAPRLVQGFDDAMEVVPPGASGDAMLYWLMLSLRDRLPATTERLRQEWAGRDPTNPGPLRSAAVDAAADLEGGPAAPWCVGDPRSSCVDHGLQLARRLEGLEPLTCDGYGLEARVLAADGQAAQAILRLEAVADQVRDRVTCLQLMARLSRATHDGAHFETALSEIARAGCGSEQDCVANLEWVAEAEAEEGSLRRAVATYKRAHERAPLDDRRLERLAQLADRAGLNAEALRDYEELARRNPTDGRWAKAAAAERDLVLSGR